MKALLVFVLTITTCVSTVNAGTCAGDVNGDGMTGFSDLVQVLAEWGACPGCAGDLDGDDSVGFSDLLAVLGDWECAEPTGPTTTLSGTVTNLWTGEPITGATVRVGEETLVTGDEGEYAGEFVVGIYDISFEASFFNPLDDVIVLFPDIPATRDAALAPVAPVVVEVEITGAADPDASVEALAVVHVLDGSMVQGFEWTQLGGADAGLDGADSQSIEVQLASQSSYKETLFQVLVEPPISAEDLPPSVPLPPGEFPGGLQDRFQVVGLNPFSLEEAGLVSLLVDVTTTSGVYAGTADVHTKLPWKPAAGIRNVPIHVPVLLHGKDQASYAWTLMRPAGSTATLLDAAAQNPEFTPDVPGLYSVSVTDLADGSDVDIFIFAGTWRGSVAGVDADGVTLPEATCLNCHNDGGVAADQFTPWLQTGHAAIFKDNLNTSTHWGPQCFSCHSVGYDTEVANGGIDDAADYDAFLDAGLIGDPSDDNFAMMATFFPQANRLSNVQCENCHGPQNGEPGLFSAAHTQVLPRVSLSSDVCATCHGEPLRHARFQQWQLSGHANYELAIDEGDSGSCSRCHTVNGFLTWLPILLGDEDGDPTGSIEVTWTTDETHPQTCVTCHDPHDSGTTSGIETDATVRISGDTPELIAGFTAYGVGRGAICMTCHNSRRGLRNDDTFPAHYQTAEASRAPHGSAQTDMIMGENAYLLEVGFRGGHSFVTDVCVSCHMEQTAPPDLLSYNQGGTNHTFFASDQVCANCHGDAVEAEFIQSGVEGGLATLKNVLENAIFDLIDELTMAGNTIDLDGDATIVTAAEIVGIEFGESRGRQAITVTFTDAAVVGPVRVNSIDVVDGAAMVIGSLYDFAVPELPKAGWNWSLVHNDGSLGVHNPTFAYSVLSKSITALDPSEPAPAPPPWLGGVPVLGDFKTTGP